MPTVFGVADERFGERLAAVVVRRPRADLDAGDVRDDVRRNLAAFTAPGEVELAPELPRTATGKVLERHLRGR